jgi:hypothetical protein
MLAGDIGGEGTRRMYVGQWEELGPVFWLGAQTWSLAAWISVFLLPLFSFVTSSWPQVLSKHPFLYL